MEYTGGKVTTFKERLNDLCNSLPMNDSEIAAMLGIPKQTLSAWRLGTRQPKPIAIIGIARQAGVSVDWLMGFDVDKNKPVEATDGLYKELIDLLMTLSPGDLQMVRGFVQGLLASHKE